MASPVSVEPFRALLQRHFPNACVVTIEAMPGGMSSRRFFRAALTHSLENTTTAEEGALPSSIVGVFTPDAQLSDEATNHASASKDWPFIAVHHLLDEAGVRVPKVFGVDYASGWMALEDLGDLTLAQALLTRPHEKEGLYRIAVRDVARAHDALSALPAETIINQRRFDQALLHWEIEHFREYALLARGIVPTDSQARRYSELATALAQYVANLPQGFVHRDYQSRNLMWLPSAATATAGLPAGELVWIDFQDALTGPRIYDLVALLNDSYQTFSRDFVEARLSEYAGWRSHLGLTPQSVIAEFDAVTVQRKLKDAGRFVYFHVKNGDPSYLKFVDPTIGKIKDSLKRLDADPLFQAWATLLDELLPGV